MSIILVQLFGCQLNVFEKYFKMVQMGQLEPSRALSKNGNCRFCSHGI